MILPVLETDSAETQNHSPRMQQAAGLLPQHRDERAAQRRSHMQETKRRFLDFLVARFREAKKLTKSLPRSDRMLTFLKTKNTNINLREALFAAYEYANSSEPLGQTASDLSQFAKNTLAAYIRKYASKNVIGVFNQLGYQSKRRSANSDFGDRHALLLGEHHRDIELKNGSLHNPPCYWLENNLDELQEADYGTLALEVPYDIDLDEWLEKGNSVWDPSPAERIQIVSSLLSEIELYLDKKNGFHRDEGAIEFHRQISELLDRNKVSLKTSGRVVMNSNRTVSKADTRGRWLSLARKAHDQGFKIVLADASRDLCMESVEIGYTLLPCLKAIEPKTPDLKKIEDYLLRKRVLFMGLRDRSMAMRIEQALKSNPLNLVALYGDTHTSNLRSFGSNSAYQRLIARNVPATNVRMEFTGMIDEETRQYNLLENRMKLENHESPIIMKLADMPFLAGQKSFGYWAFDREDDCFNAKAVPNPNQGEKPSHDAVLLFPLAA